MNLEKTIEYVKRASNPYLQEEKAANDQELLQLARQILDNQAQTAKLADDRCRKNKRYEKINLAINIAILILTAIAAFAGIINLL